MERNSSPFEILAAPFTLYLAPLTTAFPLVDTDPTAPWVVIGTSGPSNYDEAGVTIQHSQTTNFWRSLASGGPRKVFRSAEDFMISLNLADVSLEQYKNILEYNTITPTAASVGVPGTKSIGLSRGLVMNPMALLVRGPSPYGDNMAAQYEVPMCVNIGDPQPVFNKDKPALLNFKFQAIEDVSQSLHERFGRLVAQTADAET